MKLYLLEFDVERLTALHLSSTAWEILWHAIERMDAANYVSGTITDHPQSSYWRALKELKTAGLVSRVGRALKVNPHFVRRM